LVRDPSSKQLEVNTAIRTASIRIPQIIDFDIAITISEGGEAKAAIGVLSFGTHATTQDVNTVANKIQFSIPVLMPEQRSFRARQDNQS
jgi:hypothetical protein